MICKNCIFYKPRSGQPIGDCENPKMILNWVDDHSHSKNMDTDGVGHFNMEDQQSSIYVGENFGCIHFKKILPPKKEGVVLSILIPTLVERRHQFANLKMKLDRLIEPYHGQVEILSLEDNRERTTGLKRNDLIDMASGKFSAFIDDDDDVPEHYFASIFRAFHNEPQTDCIGFKGMMITQAQGRNVVARNHIFKHSVGLPYSQGLEGGMYLRPPNHLNPMLTEYFRTIRFPNLTFAEDFDFCLKLAEAGLIKNETYLDIVLYFYHYNPNKRK